MVITVGATMLALFPLALEGGPLWKPLCYAQIGGLAVATFITFLLGSVFYAIFVLDLKWIKCETTGGREGAPGAEPATNGPKNEKALKTPPRQTRTLRKLILRP